jgi:hypothetical protein
MSFEIQEPDMSFSKLSPLALAGLLAAAAPASHALVIDDFLDSGSTFLQASFNNNPFPNTAKKQVSGATSGATIVGDLRSMYVQAISGSDGTAVLRIPAGGEGPLRLSMTGAIGNAQSRADLVWDSSALSSTFPPIPVNSSGLTDDSGTHGVDLTLNDDNDPASLRANGFQLQFSPDDLGSLSPLTQFTISVWPYGSDTATSLTLSNPANDTPSLFFKFSLFAGVDFTNVGAIKLDVYNPTAGGSYFMSIALFDTIYVPEPATLGMAVLGLAGMAWSRRRAA